MKTPFEIHLTVAPVTGAMLDGFEQVCAELGGKPILIELARGVYTSQPMLSVVISGQHLSDALMQADQLTAALHLRHYEVSRIKIEIPASYAAYFPGRDPDSFAPYYEWHGKVNYDNTDALTAIALQHQAHLSSNALKTDAGRRFVTLREFGAEATFATRVASLCEALHDGGWQLLKQESEYCIYDSHVALDRGWLIAS